MNIDEKTTISHVRHLKNGQVVVINDTPANISSEGSLKDATLNFKVATKIDDFLTEIRKKTEPSSTALTVSYNELDVFKSIDAEIKYHGLTFGSTNVLEFKKVYDSFVFAVDAIRTGMKKHLDI